MATITVTSSNPTVGFNPTTMDATFAALGNAAFEVQSITNTSMVLRVASGATLSATGSGFLTATNLDQVMVTSFTFTVGPLTATFSSFGSISLGQLDGLLGDAFYAGADSVVGSAGPDQLFLHGGPDIFWAGGGNDSLFGGDGDDFIRGETGDDYLEGGAGFDDMHGNQGNDTLYGGAGNDWVVGGQDNDLLHGLDGNDVVYGNLGNDNVFGGAGDDWVRGGQGDDLVDGGAGNDLIWGDRGNDTLTGGTGADRFYTFAGAGGDRVTEFSIVEGDRVVIEGGASYTTAQVGGDTVITLTGTNDVMTLVGVTLASLPGGWIVAG